MVVIFLLVVVVVVVIVVVIVVASSQLSQDKEGENSTPDPKQNPPRILDELANIPDFSR